jgi:hypothetical protein
MKVTGTRYVPSKPWFGQVNAAAPKQYDAKALEDVILNWFKGVK